MAKIIIFGDIKTNEKVNVDPDIQVICKNADLVIANLEGPYVSLARPRQAKKGTPLSSDNNIKKLVDDLSISILNFGNNHIMDFGIDGLKESIDFSEKLGINWVGANDSDKLNKHLYVNEDFKVVIFSFSHREGPVSEIGTSDTGPYVLPLFSILEASVRYYNKKGYSVIVNYHGGEEFFNYPWPRRYAWAKQLIKAGALLVVGHHSHSIQPVLKVDDGFLALGLGNTYFHTSYQERHTGTTEGIFLEVDTVTKEFKYRLLKSNKSSARLDLLSKECFYPSIIKSSFLMDAWCKEARKRVYFNNLNVKRCDDIFLKRAFDCIWNFGSIFKRSFKSLKDRDILISAIPIFGKYILGRSINKNPKRFLF